MSRQFTESDRAVLAHLLELKVSKKEIAQRLHKDRSSVYRELKRNTSPVGYVPEEAQSRTDCRRWASRRRKMRDPQVVRYVCLRLRRFWSPDQIAGRSRREFRRQPQRQISRQTIYNWIRQQPPEECREWRACLRFGVRRRRRREDAGRLPNAVRIDGRPAIVASRRRYGDWEGDTIVGHGRVGGLLSLVERKSGFTLLARVPDRRAATVRSAAESRLLALPDMLRRTTTFDNGKEFAEHERLSAATGMAIYFAQPYAAWQRGTNENTNGLVRQYVPKGTDLKATSHRAVAAVEASLNDRPRKRLGYRTPREVLHQYAHRRGVAFDV
jgi:transposase, IS30 family